MSSNTNSGYLVIGDISGYTSYVAQTELEHSQEVLAELLGLIVNHFQPVLTVLRLEGDAVFANAPEGQIPRGKLWSSCSKQLIQLFAIISAALSTALPASAMPAGPSLRSILNSLFTTAITSSRISLVSASWWARRSTAYFV